jgi:tetratricopeptide (TPR) repeat protein
MHKRVQAHIGIALTAIFIIAMLGLSGWYGGLAAWSDVSSLRSRGVVNQWREGKGPVYTEALWQQTHDELQSALRLTPDNAQLLDDLGFLNAARAMGVAETASGTPGHDLRQRLLSSAIDNFRRASALRPTFPYTWSYLALAKHLKGDHDDELWHAFDQALRYGHNEAGAQPAMAEVAFAHWATLSVERKSGILAMLGEAPAKPRQRLVALAKDYAVTLPE